MKPNFQKTKLSLNKKTSGNPNKNREPEPVTEEKTDKLMELRAKIEKEREIMRMSGKRFNKNISTTASTKLQQTTTNLRVVEKTESQRFLKGEKKVAEVSVGEEMSHQGQEYRPATRQRVDLTSLVVETENISLNSSRIFEKQLAQQKDRNQEVVKFLQTIGLEQFSEGLINLGYDQLDVLVEVTSEELNFLMMRAAHQQVLTNALKQYREKNGLEAVKPTETMAKTITSFKVKARNEAPREKKQEKMVNAWRPKSALTVASTTPTNNSGLFSSNSNVKPNPSFFIGIGAQDWSMDSLVRRACSSCFKVFPGGELVQEDGSYYCWPCKEKQEDPLGISMNSSMIRDYKL